MEKYKFFILIGIILGIIFSGCVDKSTSKPPEQEISNPISTQASPSTEQNKILELENKINSMQSQINEMQTEIKSVNLLKPSNKTLIPNVPFRIEVIYGEWQVPSTMTFKEDNQMELRDASGTEIAQYKLFTNNNTIRIMSKKYDYYGYVLYDDYITAIYENGWISWVQKYRITPPKYNSVTGQYELP
ncbi:MAG: hypothetical protein Q7J35_11820 [Candidatus Methanoperedens sp.]|nr:hypothetical protein [Candidatus Methanoperedens sp.]